MDASNDSVHPFKPVLVGHDRHQGWQMLANPSYYDRSRGDLEMDLNDLQKKLEQLQPGKGPQDPMQLIEELLTTTLPGFERDLKEMQKNLAAAPSAQAAGAQVPQLPSDHER